MVKKYIERIGRFFFCFLYNVLPKDKIVVWDSHGASFAKDTFLKEELLEGKTALIIPKPGNASIRTLLLLARAKVFVPNTITKSTRLLQDVSHGKIIVVNIWHGAGYFKKFGKDENGIDVEEYRKKYGKPDYVICSSSEIVEKIADVFTIETESVLPLGTARSDLLFNEDYIRESKKRFFNKFPELQGKKIYLFAPTWRGVPLNGNTAHFTPEMDFERVSQNLNEDEVILVKNHQLVISNGNRCNIQYNDKVLCCDEEEIMRLIIVCDTLITDYSSVYFDAIMVDKPILFYAEDVEEYTAVNELYEDYENFCPGELITKPDPQKFVEAIRRSEKYVQTEKYQKIKRKFVGNCDGHSGERLAAFLAGLLIT